MLLTRGKRVVAEAVIDNDVIQDLMGVDTKTLMWGRQISQAGSFMAASANNGAHAANGLAAMFIASGQDVANIAESHAGIVYTQLLDNGDYYWSITLPALIVATYGGGTGLADAARVPRAARLLRRRQGPQVRRDLRRRRARRRHLALERRPARRLGDESRPPRPQPTVTRGLSARVGRVLNRGIDV